MSEGKSGRPVAPTGLLPEEIAVVLSLKPAFRARQVFKWIARGAAAYSEMSDLPAAERERLSARPLRSTSVDASIAGNDGSVKLKIRLDDGAAIESVLLTDAEGRMTAWSSASGFSTVTDRRRGSSGARRSRSQDCPCTKL